MFLCVIEHFDAHNMCPWCLQCHHPVPNILLRIKPFSNLCFLENAKVDIFRRNPVQGGLQSPVLTISGVIRPKTDQKYHLLSDSPTPPCRTSRTTTYTQLADGFLSSSPSAAPCPLYPPPHPVPPHYNYDSCILTPVPVPCPSVIPVCSNPTTSLSRTN